MTIDLKSQTLRWVLIAAEVAVAAALLAWVARVERADLQARKATTMNLQRAVELDGRNANYHLQLGRQYQYNLLEINPDRAIAHLKRATELSPFDPQPWIELGAALEFQGKIREAEASLHRAHSLAPRIPAIQWAIGNFFLLHGNVDEAFRHFKVVLNGSFRFNQVLFSTAWKASGDGDKILNELIPPSFSRELNYLYYLVSAERYSEAQKVWKRITGRGESFPAEGLARYMDSLIRARRAEEAYQVWSDLRARGLIRPGKAPTSDNLLENGGFEEALLKMGFDWRIAPVEGAAAGLDRTAFHSGTSSLLVQFSGKKNLNFRHVYQSVKVEPGRLYRLHAFLKIEGITTDSGVRIQVLDQYDPKALTAVSDDFIGSSPGWFPVTVDFKAGEKTQLILVAIARFPSKKLDNLIAGRAWIDDLELTPVTAEEIRAGR